MTISRIGIVGSGPFSGPFARALARAGVGAVISEEGWAEDSLRRLAADLGDMGTTTTLRSAAEEDVVFLSARWEELTQTLAAVADWEGRILIDATDPMLPGVGAVDLGERTSSEIVRDLSPGAQLVKGFNALPPELLAAEHPEAGGRRVIFLSGDHVRAKVETIRFVSHLGFSAVDLGGLVSGGKLIQYPEGALWGRNLVSLDR